MSDCPFYSELKPWLDGETPAARGREIEAHLATCSACSQAAADFRRLGEALRAEPTPQVPAPDVAAILVRARRARHDETTVVRFLQIVSAVAAVLILSAVLVHAWSSSDRVGVPVERVVDSVPWNDETKARDVDPEYAYWTDSDDLGTGTDVTLGFPARPQSNEEEE